MNWQSVVILAGFIAVLAGIVVAGTAWQLWVTRKVARGILYQRSAKAKAAARQPRIRSLQAAAVRLLRATGFRGLARDVERSIASTDKDETPRDSY
jgi:hypothetical protein